MAPLLEVNFDNVLAGANAIGAAKSTIAAIQSPDTGAAAGGLAGFQTAGALAGVKEAVADSLGVVAGRYEKMSEMIRGAATIFQLADQALPPQTRQQALTTAVGKSMTALGDMNPAS
ncbi:MULTISPECIES: hypothetical protein [Mycobacterium]|uniref:hypothetical protein n=1 Tax=Mycobacterium TaxID=1763 RepID=UPI0007C7D9A9|nr:MULTISPECIES: hypothetical protein [Mycobacterium]MDP7727018.1 hypothetical protein [Mycobacterium sp. TY813]